MNVSINDSPAAVRSSTRALMSRMLNPLLGMCRTIGFMSRSQMEPRFITAGGDLTGVHFLRDRAEPAPGYYHIGGSGILLDEAVIRCLGESVERYAQFVSDVTGRQTVHVASYDEMVSSGEPVIAAEKLRFFSDEQYARPRFPYKPFAPDVPMGWIRAQTVLDDRQCWIPAQLVLVGYRGRTGEHRLLSSVTTGTAAHVDRGSAVRNAMLELVQIDSAMGHWYSPAVAPQILLDGRTRPIESLINRYAAGLAARPRFHLLKNPDLPGFAVACVMRRPKETPAVGVGLGVGLRLNRAMYGALLESVGVMQMAKKALIDKADSAAEETIDPNEIYDLDTNVIHYARPRNAAFIDTKFNPLIAVAAGDLPPDIELDPRGEARLIAQAFRDSGKDLFWLDLTTPDAHELGFVVSRVWSPDTLSLSLPSAPPVRHPRFAAYGGATQMRPHPYP